MLYKVKACGEKNIPSCFHTTIRSNHHCLYVVFVQALTIEAPLDDSVSVDDDATEKGAKQKNKKDGNKYEFHFEFDNTVVVDDKKALVEDAWVKGKVIFFCYY